MAVEGKTLVNHQVSSCLLMVINRDFCIIPKAENIGVLVAQKKDFTPHFVELISD